MYPMPSYALLSEAVGQPFHLWLSPEQVLPVELLGVEEGIAMTLATTATTPTSYCRRSAACPRTCTAWGRPARRAGRCC